MSSTRNEAHRARKDSLGCIKIFPSVEASDSERHPAVVSCDPGACLVRAVWIFLSAIKSKGLQCPLTWALVSSLGRNSHRYLKGRELCFWGFIRVWTYLQKCSSAGDWLMPDWWVPCFPEELFVPEIKEPKEGLCCRFLACLPCACLSTWPGWVVVGPKILPLGETMALFWAWSVDLGLRGIFSRTIIGIGGKTSSNRAQEFVWMCPVSVVLLGGVARTIFVVFLCLSKGFK